MKRSEDAGVTRKKLQDYSYLLSQNIGKGYSSQVFRGRNDVTDQQVAVKVIDMKMIKGEVHRNLLASEIEVLKTLKNCEHIIEVFDIYNTKNNTYIITELCNGGDMSKLLASRKCLPESEAIAVMKQIIKGYLQIHAHCIIHRDLKPANIFLADSQIKIADFGFAMKVSDNRKYSSYNVGSPVYMPPEALNENKYSFKSDIWALGVIYYELLTGKTPWRAKTEKELAKQLISIPIKKLLPPSISQSSQNFLLRTLTLDINDRMGPQELQRFVLTSQKLNLTRQLYSTENSIFDGRNNHIRKNDASVRGDRTNQALRLQKHETSLTKNSLSTPTNSKKLAFMQSKQQFKAYNFSLPRTAATISNKTENFLHPPSSSTTLHNVEALTQKQINSTCSVSGKQESAAPQYDRKQLSKELLSQIHMCRFLYKLIMRMGDKLDADNNQCLLPLKEIMCGLIFDKLAEVDTLRRLNGKVSMDYRGTSDFAKIAQIVSQYKNKYSKDLAEIKSNHGSLTELKERLTGCILHIYGQIEENCDLVAEKEKIIVLDYLVTLRQLVSLLQTHDMQNFHNKSKIEAIVEGAPAKMITADHLAAIKSKLKATKIL